MPAYPFLWNIPANLSFSNIKACSRSSVSHELHKGGLYARLYDNQEHGWANPDSQLYDSYGVSISAIEFFIFYSIIAFNFPPAFPMSPRASDIK